MLAATVRKLLSKTGERQSVPNHGLAAVTLILLLAFTLCAAFTLRHSKLFRRYRDGNRRGPPTAPLAVQTSAFDPRSRLVRPARSAKLVRHSTSAEVYGGCPPFFSPHR